MDFRSGVVIVFSIFTFCTTSSVPGSNFGSNSRFYQTESLLFYDWIAINWTVYFVTSSTGGVTTSLYLDFDTWLELLLRYLSVRLDHHFYDLVVLLTAIMYDFVHWLFVTLVVGVPSPTFHQ